MLIAAVEPGCMATVRGVREGSYDAEVSVWRPGLAGDCGAARSLVPMNVDRVHMEVGLTGLPAAGTPARRRLEDQTHQRRGNRAPLVQVEPGPHGSRILAVEGRQVVVAPELSEPVIDSCQFSVELPGGSGELLDRLLAQSGIAPEQVSGPEAGSHLEVAMTVATGQADTGLGVRAAAIVLGLEFIPAAWEEFDLILSGAMLPSAEPLIAALRDPAVQIAVQSLGGYDTSRTGTIETLA